MGSPLVRGYERNSGRIRRLVKKWKDMTNGRSFLVKGIQCAEDAIKAVEAGCDGVVVSTHAGRQVDGAIGSLEALPEVGSEL